MQTIEVSPGAAIWKCTLSKQVKVRQPKNRFDAMVKKCSHATVKTIVGELTADELEQGVDVDEFVAQVWEHATANSDENMDDDVIMHIEINYEFGGVIDIAADGQDVSEFTRRSEFYPVGLTGRWVN